MGCIMKRKIGTYIAGACVAGLVAGVPLAAVPDAGPGGQAQAAQTITIAKIGVSEDVSVCLYGPPSVFEEPVQVLYGPPSISTMWPNPMVVKATPKAVTASKAALRAYTFPRAITVKKAKGAVTFAKVAKGSSKALSVNKRTGAVKLAKGAKKGLHTMKVKVKAAGTNRFVSTWETVTVKVRVK